MATEKRVWIAQSMTFDESKNRFKYTNDIEVLTNKKALNAYIENRTVSVYQGAVTDVVRNVENTFCFTINYNYHTENHAGKLIVVKCKLLFRKIQINEGRNY